MILMAGLPVVAQPVLPANGLTTNLHSVFILPASPKDGRDPFFPSSMHPYQSAVIPSARTTDLNLDTLTMHGISGVPPHRLVIINKRTFAVGDYAEVSTSQGRIRVHCLEINANSVVIEVNGERHELRYQEKQ